MPRIPKPIPLALDRRPKNLAPRPAARHVRAVRRRAGGDARGGRASRLRADRHDQRHRALAPPHPLHPHPGLPARATCTGADGRQERLRILDARALLRADARHPLLPRRRCGATGRTRIRWFGTVPKPDLRKVLARLRRDGALTIRDIDDDVLVDKEHPWASRKPSKRALQLAFYRGEVTISERAGMLKTYELMDRHFGWEKRPRPASEREVSDYLLDRALRAQGIVSLDSVCYLDAPRKPAIRKLIEARVRAAASSCRSRSRARARRSIGRRPEALEEPPAPVGAGPHPLAVRPADHPAQAAKAVLRLRAPLRGLCAEGEARASAISRCRCSSATRSSRRSTSRPIARSGKLLMQKWTWVGKGSPRAAQAPHRGGAAPLREISARR